MLKITDRATAFVRRATGNFQDMDRALARLSKHAEVAANLGKVADGFDRVGASARGAIAAPLMAAANLEEGLDRIAAKSGASVDQIAAIKARARELGADPRFKFSAAEAAQGFEVLSSAGIGVEDQLQAIEPMLVLAAAGFTTVDQAVKLNTDTLGAWGLGIEESARVSDLLIGAANTTKQSIDSLSNSLTQVGPVASKAGASIDEVLALQGVLAAGGITGSSADTVSRNLYQRLQAPSTEAARILRRLHVSTKDAKGNMRSLDAIMQELSAKMDKRYGVGKKGNARASDLKQIFGDEAVAGAQLAMSAATSGMLEETRKGIAAFDATAAATAAADNVVGAMATAKAAAEELAITAGDHLLPVASELLGELTAIARVVGQWAAEHPGAVKGLAATAAGVAALTTILGPLTRLVALAVTSWGYLGVAFAGLKSAALVAAGGIKTLTAALLANPIGAIIAGVVALVAAGYLLWKNWDDVAAFFVRLWDRLPGPVQSALRLITAPIRILIAGLRLLWGAALELGRWFAGVWERIPAPVKIAVAVLAGPIGWIVGIAALIRDNWSGLSDWFESTWGTIAAAIGSAIDLIAEKIAWAGGQIEELERSLPEWVTGRDRVVAGSTAARMRAIQASASGEGPTPGDVTEAASRFAGALKITIASEGGGVSILGTETRTTGAPIDLDTGTQGVG